MRGLYMRSNPSLTQVGSNLISSLQNLTYADFTNNGCIHQLATDASQIPALIENLRLNCTDFEDETTTMATTTNQNLPTTTPENPTCGNLNEIICELEEQNQFLIQQNSEMKSEILEIRNENLEAKEKLNQISEDNSNMNEKLNQLAQENSEMKEILTEIMQGILDLTSRPCGI
jgi:uncharacterized coiled-coil DUF342 family protein